MKINFGMEKISMNKAMGLVSIILLGGSLPARAQLRCEEVFGGVATPVSEKKITVVAPSKALGSDKVDIKYLQKIMRTYDQSKIDQKVREKLMNQVFHFALTEAAAKDPNLTAEYISWSAMSAFLNDPTTAGNVPMDKSPYALKFFALMQEPYVISILERAERVRFNELTVGNLFYLEHYMLKSMEMKAMPLASQLKQMAIFAKLKTADELADTAIAFNIGGEKEVLKIETVVKILEPFRAYAGGEFTAFITKYAFNANRYRLLEYGVAPPADLQNRMIRENVLEALGQPHKLVQDVYLHRPSDSDAQMMTLLLTSKPVKGSTDFMGFSISLLASRPAKAKAFHDNYSWNFAGKKSRASIQYSPLAFKNSRPLNESAPRYSEMVKDGSLGGLVMISKNLGDFTPELGNYYLEHYATNGYRVKDDVTTNYKRAQDEILDLIKQGHVDWIARDGHHEINTDAVLSFESRIRIIKLEKGADVVTLVISLPKTPDQAVKDEGGNLTYDDLGEALRTRKTSERQVLYFDSSCFAASDVGKLIGNVSAAGFTPVASSGVQETFTGMPGTSIYEFLKGMQGRRSYDQINAAIKDAKFRFPNDKEYITESDPFVQPARVKITRDYQTLIKVEEN